ncbi:tyrosine-type recombinase/integrase [Priestia megaterium]
MPYVLRKVKRIAKNGNKHHYILFSDKEVVLPVQDYLRYLLLEERKENTIKSYAQHLKTYFTYLELRGLQYDEIHEDRNGLGVLITFLSWLRNPETVSNVVFLDKRETRSAVTTNIIMSTVIQFYSYLSKTGLLQHSSYSVIGKNNVKYYEHALKGMTFSTKKKISNQNMMQIRVGKKQITAVTRSEYESLMKEITKRSKKPLRNQLMLALMFECGVRSSELRGICIEDISPWEQKLYIREREISIKYGSERTLDINENVLELYAAYIQNEYDYDAVDETKEYHYLFPNPKGGYLSYSTIKTFCDRLSSKSGIKFNPHELRHGHGTELMEFGTAPEVIRVRLGHKYLSSTEIYKHVRPEFAKRELQKAEAKRKERDEKRT